MIKKMIWMGWAVTCICLTKWNIRDGILYFVSGIVYGTLIKEGVKYGYQKNLMTY